MTHAHSIRPQAPCPRRRAAALVAAVGVVAFAGLWPRVSGGPAPAALVPPAGIPLWGLHSPFPPPEVRPSRPPLRIPVTVTGYSSCPRQTDDTPYLTAANTRVRRGIIALSRDLLQEFTPGAPFRFGDVLLVEGAGIYRVEDTMAARYRRRADIWFSSRAAAVDWGRRKLTLVQLPKDRKELERRVRDLAAVPAQQVQWSD